MFPVKRLHAQRTKFCHERAVIKAVEFTSTVTEQLRCKVSNYLQNQQKVGSWLPCSKVVLLLIYIWCTKKFFETLKRIRLTVKSEN